MIITILIALIFLSVHVDYNTCGAIVLTVIFSQFTNEMVSYQFRILLFTSLLWQWTC